MTTMDWDIAVGFPLWCRSWPDALKRATEITFPEEDKTNPVDYGRDEYFFSSIVV